MFPNIIQRVFFEPWCILESVHYAIQDLLFEHMEGHQQIRVNGDAQVPFTPMAAGAGLNPPTARNSRVFTRGPLAVIPVRGIIGSHLSNMDIACGGYGVEQLSLDLERVQEATEIKRVMVDFHSPGGAVTGVPEVAKQFAALGQIKETFSFTSGQSASASLWMSSQANHSYMTESASVGSIGVYVSILDKSKAMEARGEQMRVIRSGKHKAAGAPGVPLTDEDIARIQAQVDTIGKMFRSSVKSKRTKVDAETMQGQMFFGKAAKDVGLVDSLVSSFGSLVKRLS